MRALVTGSNGFVGQHLVELLRSEGDEVSGLDRTEGVDITDEAAVRRRVEDRSPEVVYHLAGFSDVGASWDDPSGAFLANGLGTLHVLTAARAAGVRRVLVVSSADVYGTVSESDLPLDETHPVNPVTPYGASKLAAEHLAAQAWNGHGLETVRTRSFNHLGPGQSPRFVAGAIADRVARAELSGGDRIEVGNVTPRRDFTDVRDVVRAYRLLMEHGEAGDLYHVCSGHDVSIRAIAEKLLALAERPLELAVDPALQRPVDIPVHRGDPTKLERATGWTPRIPLDRTLADMLAGARRRAGTTD